MVKTPRVSIIMGVFNGGEFLELAIESIIAQSYSDWEFIICDDCSTDDSSYILSKYSKDKRFVIIKNEENLGLGATLNKCSEIACGEYLARMDADDISCRTRLAEQVKFLDGNPHVKVLGTWAFLYNELEEIWGDINPPIQPILKDWLYGPSVIHASVMMRRESLIAIGGYNADAFRIEDYDLWLRMLAEGYDIRSIPLQLYGIRWTKNDYSRKKIKYRWLDFKCRLKAFRRLHIPLMHYRFVLKPILPVFVPRMLYALWHMKNLKKVNVKHEGQRVSDYCPTYYAATRCFKNNKILLLARYAVSGASTRVRSLQYFSYLRRHGYKLTYSILLGESYLKRLYSGRRIKLANVMRQYWARVWLLIKLILRVEKFDIIWVEYEIFPWLPVVAEYCLRILKIPYFVDYDDAVFHKYDMHANKAIRFCLRHKIDRVMQYSSLTIAGNEYIRQRAKNAKTLNIENIPTVVDIRCYKKAHNIANSRKKFTIGWIGSPSTSKYLEMLHDVLLLLQKKIEYEFVVVGAEEIDMSGVSVALHKWSMSTEVEEIQSFDVGLMPLPNGNFEKGKCGYKLIQYMACEIPVIASPVGVNEKLVDHGVNGFLASNAEEWLSHLEFLAFNPKIREKMGKAGRLKVIEQYSCQAMAPKLLACINNAIHSSL